MVAIFQILAVAASVLIEGSWAKYIACVFPAIYIILIAPGVYTRGNDVDFDRLKEVLSEGWRNAEQLAPFMKKYWAGLEYSMISEARESNCFVLSIISIGLAIYYYLKLSLVVPTVILSAFGIFLYVMSERVNHPLGVFKDKMVRNNFNTNERLRDEFRLAVTSLVAFSEIFPDSERHQYVADMVLEDEFAREIVNNWKIQ